MARGTRLGTYALLLVVTTTAASGCAGEATRSVPSTVARSTSASPSPIPDTVLATLCTMVPAAVDAATKYYGKTDLATVDKVVTKANALLAGQADAAIYADEITSAYLDYRLSLIKGPEATYAAFTRWHDACVARGLPLA